jgi:beta-glucosidase
VPTGLPSGPPADLFPFLDPGRPLTERVEDLLSRLTPAERIAMLHQYGPAVPRLSVAAFRTGTEALHGVAWLGAATVFPQPVGLGATWDEELVHQVATATSIELRAFHHHRRPTTGDGPISLQAWAPVVNLLRDPRWGRNEEGYAEDPLLTARLADAFCRGMAGDDPEFLRTAPVLKHFLAYNHEDDRCTTSSSVRPRVLHEYDLAAFRRAVESGAATGVMAAYNLVNGRPCHVSPLIERELRRWITPAEHELFVVSDADAPSNLVDPEHYFDDHATAHAAALKAGIDSFTDHGEDSATTIARITEALKGGLLTDAGIDQAVRRQLSLRFRLGEFDPGRDPYAGISWDAVDSPAHRALARRAATESVVLLRNDASLLPLVGTGRIAVVGPLAKTVFEDLYSGALPYRVTAAAGLTDRVAEHGGTVTTVEGVDRVVLRATSIHGLLTTEEDTGRLSVTPAAESEEPAAFDLFDWDLGVLTLRSALTGRYVGLNEVDQSLTADRVQPGGWFVGEAFRLEPAADGTELLRSVLTGRYAVVDPVTGAVTVTADIPSAAERFTRTVVRDGIAEAVAAAVDAEAVVMVLGNDPHINGRETQDRANLMLPPGQERLLRAVVAARPETVLVVMSSYPYAVDWADEHAAAVVWTAHGGQETGNALASVLLGDVDPAGRLPQTWYRADTELPGRLDYDVIKAGWTYQYHRKPPLYPFGHGLSYTRFDYTDLRMSMWRTTADSSVTISLTMANTGSRPGKETVQLYVRAVGARYEAPLLKLAAFRKVSLRPGSSREVEFALDVSEALAHWSVTEEAFIVDPGEYEVLVARSAGNVVMSAPLTVTGPEPAPRTAVTRRVSAVNFDDYVGITLVDATRTDGDAEGPGGARHPGLPLGGSDRRPWHHRRGVPHHAGRGPARNVGGRDRPRQNPAGRSARAEHRRPLRLGRHDRRPGGPHLRCARPVRAAHR